MNKINIMNARKKQLLDNLKNDTFCRIGVSKIHGVGVIAIKDIPKGTNPFKISSNVCQVYDSIYLSEKEINQLNPNVTKIVKDFIAPNANGKYSVPYDGLNSLDISFYMNHSLKNNIGVIDDQCEFVLFITNRLIKKGEELTINYNDFL